MPRLTTYIEKKEALKFFNAAFKSQEIGFPLNSWLTVDLERASYSDHSAISKWAAIRKQLHNYHAKHDCPFVAIWVLENSQKNGVHAHCILHRNTELIGAVQEEKKQIQKALNSTNFNLVKLNKFYDHISWEANLENLISYCLKGIRPCHANLINRTTAPQGIIHGKRIGWTQMLS